MQPRVPVWRIIADATTLLALLGIAYHAGTLTQRLNQMERAVATRGSVQISMEADQRLTRLEQQMDNLERR